MVIVSEGGRLIGSFGWELGGNSDFSALSLSFKNSVSLLSNFMLKLSRKLAREFSFIASSVSHLLFSPFLSFSIGDLDLSLLGFFGI